jgi:hypothetical protein
MKTQRLTDKRKLTICFDEYQPNIESIMDKVLANAPCFAEITEIENEPNEDTIVTLSVPFDCTWTHIDATWGDNGGDPPEDDVEYQEIDPKDFEEWLSNQLPDASVSINDGCFEE